MTPDEILRELIPEVVKKLTKKADEKQHNEHDTLDNVPEFYPNYRKIVTDYNSIRVHAVKHIFPHRLFAERSPNQTDDEFKYVKKNFKKVTMPTFVDFINLIHRAFFDQNYSIDYSNQPEGSAEKEDSFENYLKKELYEYGSIDVWLKSLPSIKIIDAMGVIAVRPLEPKTRIVDGEETIDDTELPEPQPFYYPCSNVLAYKDDEYFLVLTERHSWVDYGNRKEKTGLIFEFYDKDSVYFIEQIGKKNEYKFEIRQFFQHDMGYPPVKFLDGITTNEDGCIYKQSPFLYSVDNLDLVLLNATNLQLACNNSVYPVKIMIGNPCSFTTPEGLRCNGGFILDPANQSRTTCPNCKGSGLQQRTSPLGVYLIRPKTTGTEQESPQDAIRFVSPETSSLEFLVKRINEDEKRARMILHLSTSNEGVGENVIESGAKAKATTAFIKPISDQIFDMLEFVIDCIRKQRYGVDSKIPNPEVMRPNSFDLLTHQDYLNEISEAIKNGLPSVVVHAAIDRYITSMYRNEKDKLRVYKLLFEADRFLMNTDEEVIQKVQSRTANDWEQILHDSGILLIAEVERENKGFWDMEIEKQKEILVKKAQDKALSLPKPTPVPTIGDNIGQSTDNTEE